MEKKAKLFGYGFGSIFLVIGIVCIMSLFSKGYKMSNKLYKEDTKKKKKKETEIAMSLS